MACARRESRSGNSELPTTSRLAKASSAQRANATQGMYSERVNNIGAQCARADDRRKPPRNLRWPRFRSTQPLQS
eukprot:14751413-Alexandrium_andersonii.AAC.1